MPQPQAVKAPPSPEQIKWLISQVHPIHSLKRDIWVQIDKSYIGGIVYKYAEPNYLHKFSLRENNTSYDERKKRAVYFNNTKPMANMLVGFLRDPRIDKYSLGYVMEKADGLNSLKIVCKKIALISLLMPCGILVDSPKFDPELVKTEADRASLGLNPYVTIYPPWKIRNFYIDKSGILQWILLDNSTYDNVEPFGKANMNVSLRLWTREIFQDFNCKIPVNQSEGGGVNQAYLNALRNIYTGNLDFIAGPENRHSLGEISFFFQNWEDKDNVKLPDTNFEDVVLYDQAVYNYMSLMDEMLSGGVFKWLAYPGKIPQKIASEGWANLSTITYSDTSTHEPKFIGPALDDVNPFITAINFYLLGAKRTFGLDTDQEKSYVQSGTAKRFDFTKVKALLESGASSMEQCIKNIFRLCGLWDGKTEEKVKVEYARDFLGEEEEAQLVRLYQVMTMGYREVRKRAAKKIVAINFDGDEQDDLNAMNDDIDETEAKPAPRKAMTPQEMADMEKAARQQGNNQQNQSGAPDQTAGPGGNNQAGVTK